MKENFDDDIINTNVNNLNNNIYNNNNNNINNNIFNNNNIYNDNNIYNQNNNNNIYGQNNNIYNQNNNNNIYVQNNNNNNIYGQNNNNNNYNIDNNNNNKLIRSEFFGKKIVITGASSGVGLSVSTYFLNSGANVILVGRDETSLIHLSKNFPLNSTIILCDLTKDIQIFDLKTSVIERFGSIDILINCAGIKFDGDIEKTFPQDFDYTIDVNLRSIFLLIKSFEKFYNNSACIVNCSCIYGTRPMYGMISYCMSKAGLESLTKSFAAEYSSNNIRVNGVSACPIESNSLRYARVNEKEINSFREKMKKNIPLGRIAMPDDIAKVIIYLTSKRSSSITGKIIKVDGGRSLTSSGYVHYKGYKNMNSRFEPDGYNFFKNFNFFGLIDGNEDIEKIEKLNDKDLKNFVIKKINESNFSTRLNDAHVKLEMNYNSIDDNDKMLFEKYTLKKV